MTEVDLLEKNRKALAKRPELRDLLDAAESLPEDQILEARSGDRTARVEGPEGSSILLASKYKPREEARRMAEGLPYGPMTTYFVLGLGMGYHLLEIDRRRMPESRIVVIEADPRVFRTALTHVDLSRCLANDRVVVHVGGNPSQLFHELRNAVFDLMASEIQLVPHAPSMQSQSQYYEVASQLLEEFVRGGSMTVRTAMILSKVSFSNRYENLVEYLTSGGVRVLGNRYRGVPGVIVSAGPSLHRNIDRLAELENRAVLFAVSTALKPLLGRGITPHFSVLLDYHLVSRRYFDRIDPEIAKGIPLVYVSI